ncbi:MAG: restriction endonuclease subunit S [Nitrobacter sp.]|uniref:restriction endonuclease subunit S n=1 Tax=Nitrobacter sp. TaxID=29420 RepID=UPI002626DF49|nr:restriction endonuclease subunit S [Nitrobacter sp.]MCV0386864.1 restriction endonuclease subunit S [Nitrobacter sp.]
MVTVSSAAQVSPEDDCTIQVCGWRSLPIRNVAPLQRGFDLPNSQVQTGDVPIVYSNGIERFHNRAMVKGPGVVTGRSGTLGKVHYVENDFWPHNTSLWVTNFNGNIPKFVYYVYSYIGFQRFASGSGVPTLNRNDAHSFEVSLPSSAAEQQAIAEALSDADALIEELEALIAKKRAIKQSAMQDLLSGCKRLPGFSGEWLDSAIHEIADCLDNLRVPLNGAQRAGMVGYYPYCGANGVLDFVDGYCLDDDVILMAEDGGYFDEYESRPIAYRMSGKIWVNNHAHILKAKAHFDNDFLFFSLVHKNILPFLASGTRAKLNKSEMNKITIRHPQNKDEQKSIAEVLNSIELELDALGSRLDKARQIKQGMMQELLTGRVRLV